MAEAIISGGSLTATGGGGGGGVVTQPVASQLNATVVGPAAADTPATGNPVLVAGVDAAGNVQEFGVADANTTAPAQTLSVGGTFNITPATLTTGQIGALQLDSAQNLLVNLKTAIPAGANVIGHVITDTGSTTAVTGNVTVVQPTGTNLHVVVDSGSALTATVTGTKSVNTAAPGATNVGTLPAQANAASQAWTEGFQVPISVDLTGRQRIRGTLTHNNATPTSDLIGVMNGLANAVAPTYVEGDIVLQSVDLSGNTRIIGTRTNNATVPSFQVGVIPALANAAAPTLTEGFQTLLSVNLAGSLRTTGGGVAQASTTSGELGPLVQGAVTTAAPTYTTATTNPLSLDTAGNLRVSTTPAAGAVTTVTGNLTNNNAAPAANNVGVLPFLANAANPTWTEGDLVTGSVDLSGHQRVVATGPTAGGVAATGNPVQIGAVYNTAPATLTNGQTAQLQSTNKGLLEISPGNAASAIGDNQVTVLQFADSSNNSRPITVADTVYGGAFSGTADAARQGWNKMRASTVFRTVQATAAGSTAVWTAAAGNKWRLLKVFIQITDNASLAAGAVLTVSLLDVAASINIAFDIFVPTTAVTTTVGTAAQIQLDLGQFGILAAATATALNVNLSAALVTGNVRVIVQGTEE